MNESDSQRRRRLINLGELIALAALLVSGVGVWINWKSSEQDKPARVIEQRQAVPLVLKGTPQGDGRALDINPVDPSHALESLTLAIKGAPPIELGSDGTLDSSSVESALKSHSSEPKERTLAVPVRIDARYVEAGTERRAGGAYKLRYRWQGGGLFGGRSLRLVGLSR